MKDHTLDPVGFDKQRRRMITYAAPFLLLALVAGQFVVFRDGIFTPSSLAVFPILLAVSGYGLRKGISNQRDMWFSYRLDILVPTRYI